MSAWQAYLTSQFHQRPVFHKLVISEWGLLICH